jgi:hypothetical protein
MKKSRKFTKDKWAMAKNQNYTYLLKSNYIEEPDTK